jgi:hypothetical protein
VVPELTYQLASPFWQFVDYWQTLITGVLALVADLRNEAIDGMRKASAVLAETQDDRRPPGSGMACAASEAPFRVLAYPSSLWFRPASQFNEARSLCQSRHAVKAADITTAVPKAPSNATIIAMIATKVSVIKVHPISCLCANTASIGLRPLKVV